MADGYSAFHASTAIGTVTLDTMGAPSNVAPSVNDWPPRPAGRTTVATHTPGPRRSSDCTPPG
jgi:hypothetical protein